MTGVGRERVEVVPGVRHLVALVDLEAHPEEDVLDLTLDLCEEVKSPAPELVAGQRHVERALRVELFESFVLDRVATPFDGSLQLRADPVQQHAALAITHGAKGLREIALPAEVLDASVVKLTGRRGGRDRLLRFL